MSDPAALPLIIIFWAAAAFTVCLAVWGVLAVAVEIRKTIRGWSND